MRGTFAGTVAVCVALVGPVGGQDAAHVARTRRQAHEREIVADYLSFLRLPNVAKDAEHIRQNADAVMKAMAARGLNPRLLTVPGAPPVVYGELVAPHPTHTYVLYAHYDGQPVDLAQWATPPFEPVVRAGRLDKGAAAVALPASGPIDPDWRIYGRSASDDKAPIVTILTALDALQAARMVPPATIKFVFEGEEELGSPHLPEILKANRDLLRADLWVIRDGPEYGGRQTITFGARGFQGLDITVYGPARELHSGHYGNWAPNPALMLAQLLASMKDADGRVLVPHFYDDVVPLTAEEQQALSDLPNNDEALKKDLGLARTEGAGASLSALINEPSLNIRGLASGHVGDASTNVVPSTATASIDLRLVKGLMHDRQAERIIDHIRAQGYFVTSVEPTPGERQTHPRIARVVVEPGGYDAVRTPLDLAVVRPIIAALRAVRTPLSLQPTSGGSVPLSLIERELQTHTVLVPTANPDNNQHSANENLRIGHLWNAIETDAALLMTP
jgi:acetylornithine deacetylase/succinyl-diaminopimelate desuccinylase-like protein